MGQPYVGEIRMVGFNFAPVGWMLCQGQSIPISENETLFTLIGTTYGGDGQTTFNLPDLSSRNPIHMGQGSGTSNRTIGESGGTEQVTLTQQQIPSHGHVPQANTAGGTPDPNNTLWGGFSGGFYTAQNQPDSQTANAVQLAGGSQPHDNMPPFLVVSFIISMFGIFPTPT